MARVKMKDNEIQDIEIILEEEYTVLVSEEHKAMGDKAEIFILKMQQKKSKFQFNKKRDCQQNTR